MSLRTLTVGQLRESLVGLAGDMPVVIGLPGEGIAVDLLGVWTDDSEGAPELVLHGDRADDYWRGGGPREDWPDRDWHIVAE